MAPLELIIPLLGAGAASIASIVKSWLAKKSERAITINLGNGSQVTVDGSEESLARVREILSKLVDTPDLRKINPSSVQAGDDEKRSHEE